MAVASFYTAAAGQLAYGAGRRRVDQAHASPLRPRRPSRARAKRSGSATDVTAVARRLPPVAPQQQQQPQQQPAAAGADPLAPARAARRAARAREQAAYQAAAVAATALVGALAVAATYTRIAAHLARGEPFPYAELVATVALAFGGAVGMEAYARVAHKAIWHDTAPGWALHASHHAPRTGPFEANDVYALANAAPAMALCAYGFLRPDVVGGLCFGAGLGITLFGISYMFVHDGLVHRRFPVGPIADVPLLRRVAVAHTLHHSDKYGGVPFGLFLGPQELEAVGAGPELDRLVEEAAARAAAERERGKAGAR